MDVRVECDSRNGLSCRVVRADAGVLFRPFAVEFGSVGFDNHFGRGFPGYRMAPHPGFESPALRWKSTTSGKWSDARWASGVRTIRASVTLTPFLKNALSSARTG